jgi:hypothetical protein
LIRTPGLKIEEENKMSNDPVMSAVRSFAATGNVAALQKAVQSNSVEVLDEQGYTTLFRLLQLTDNIEGVKVLVNAAVDKKGFILGKTDRYNAYYLALQCGYREVAKYLYQFTR